LRNYIKFILLFLLTVFIFWFFGRNLNWTEVRQAIEKANIYYLILANIVICLGFLFRAKRWQVLLSTTTETSLKELFAATTVGFSIVLIFRPAGEIARAVWISMRDKRVRPSLALVTLFLERIFDLASIVCFFAVNLLWFQSPVGREADFAYFKFAGNLMLVGVVFGIASLLVFQIYSPKIIAWFENLTFLPKRLQQIIVSLTKQLAGALHILRDWKQLFSVVFWTLALWFSISIPTYLVLLAFDLPLSFSASLFIMGFAAFSSVIPTPGGAAGAFHTATAASLIFLNIDKDQAAAASIIMHLVYFAPAVVFGVYYFVRGDVTFERLRSLISNEQTAEEVAA
jgi:glycosyltransferase 2 family protein